MRAPVVSSMVAASLAIAAPVAAHIEMTAPAPRSRMQKEGPCGVTGSTRGATVTSFAPGETITVEWDETVDHPGHYRIAFDIDGNNDFIDPAQPDDAFASTLVDQITDRVGGRYTQDVTLPDVTCDTCTLQLIQVMNASAPYSSFYYQCADLTLAGDPAPGDDTGGGTSGGCSARGRGGPGGVLIVLGIVALARRRRR